MAERGPPERENKWKPRAPCSCCGLEHEDQDHMFHCQSTNTKARSRRGSQSWRNSSRKATPQQHSQELHEQSETSLGRARTTSKSQEFLGTMAILRGHRHNDSYHTIKRTYKKRTQPPGTEKKKTPKDKPSLELCATLVRESWRFFEKICIGKQE